jgi:hypothetical protein
VGTKQMSQYTKTERPIKGTVIEIASRREAPKNVQRLWGDVERAAAHTTSYRLADDPDARRALSKWELIFLADEKSAGSVVPFTQRRRP